jgi:2-amino-4-hydroxy-6-hydroxymethyldihydropteridine diphosphokinase
MHTAYVGMGANLPSPAGPPEATLVAAAVRLGDLGRMVARSSLYSTAPVGLLDQPRFINAVLGLDTFLDPGALLDALLDLERAFGRNRLIAAPKGPRSLDLDILLMGDITLREPSLEIPHPRLVERAFVLVPLNEIAPHAVDPRSGNTSSQLLEALEKSYPAAIEGVVPIASRLWPAGAGPGARGSRGGSGTTTGQPYHHRHR